MLVKKPLSCWQCFQHCMQKARSIKQLYQLDGTSTEALNSPGVEPEQLKLNLNVKKKKLNKTDKRKENQRAMRFGGGWKPAASPLNLQLGSGPVHHALITIIKKTRHKLLKNIRTSVLKTHSQITHTYLGCLPHLLLCWFSHLILIYWTDIWTFHFLFIITLSISSYFCLPPFILASFFSSF